MTSLTERRVMDIGEKVFRDGVTLGYLYSTHGEELAKSIDSLPAASIVGHLLAACMMDVAHRSPGHMPSDVRKNMHAVLDHMIDVAEKAREETK